MMSVRPFAKELLGRSLDKWSHSYPNHNQERVTNMYLPVYVFLDITKQLKYFMRNNLQHKRQNRLGLNLAQDMSNTFLIKRNH